MDAMGSSRSQKNAVTKGNRRDIEGIDEVTRQVSRDPAVIRSLLTALGQKGTARFRAAKELQLVSQQEPALLYPHFQVLAQLLDSPSSVLLWNCIIILSRLAAVDTQKRFDAVFYRYYAHLWDGKLVTAANILGSSGRIARCRPDLADRVTAELLKVDRIPLPTAECREVARGHVLAAFAEYLDGLKGNRSAHDFVVRCTRSHRASVKKQAEGLLDKMGQADHRKR